MKNSGILIKVLFAALLPVTFLVSVLVVISNISLIHKEGFNITNVMGILLAVIVMLLIT